MASVRAIISPGKMELKNIMAECAIDIDCGIYFADSEL